MAEKPSKPVDEEAHFRLDDHARQLDALKKAGDAMPHALISMLRPEVERLVREEMDKFKREDKAEDRKMIAEAMSKAFDREESVEKHGTVETAEGVHKVHVIETRRRKA